MSLPVFAHLTSRALIGVRGADWRSFLQNLLSNDVETLAEGEIRAALLLTPQGKFLFDMFVTPHTDGEGREGALLDVQAQQREALVGRLKLYRLRSKVEIEPMEGAVFASWGGEGAPGEGWMADPRLPALGWRGYGLAVEGDGDHARLDGAAALHARGGLLADVAALVEIDGVEQVVVGLQREGLVGDAVLAGIGNAKRQA